LRQNIFLKGLLMDRIKNLTPEELQDFIKTLVLFFGIAITFIFFFLHLFVVSVVVFGMVIVYMAFDYIVRIVRKRRNSK
jgi:hypothetical protein